MAADDMPKLVRNHALHFVCGGRGVNQSTVQIDCLPARNECIDGFVIDQDDVDIVRVKPGRGNQWRGNFFEKSFGFSIAQNGLRHNRAHGYPYGKKQHQCCSQGTKYRIVHMQ